MSEINNESMEKMVTCELEPETDDTEMDNCNISGVVKVIGAVLAVGAGVIAGAAMRKNLKAKKESDKPKTKKKLMWVEVPVEDVEVESEVIDTGAEVKEEKSKPKTKK